MLHWLAPGSRIAFGFGACLLFWFTGSLLPGVALHALNNALVPFARERAPHETNVEEAS